MIRVAGDSRQLVSILPRNKLTHLIGKVPCVVGSPPYNCAIVGYPSGYDDHVPWPDYEVDARHWAQQIHALLCPGGRAWVVMQPTVPLVPGEAGGDRVNLAHLWMHALSSAGLHYRDTVFWVQDSFDGACAWGSWLLPSAPNLRGGYEVVLLYYKNQWKRPTPREHKGKKLDRDGPGGDWVDLVRNVWKINPANQRTGMDGGKVRKLAKPALYPVDVPRRAIRLSTWPGEWVVDPWAGHCTTGYAADELGRESVMVDLGYDMEELVKSGPS